MDPITPDSGKVLSAAAKSIGIALVQYAAGGTIGAIAERVFPPATPDASAFSLMAEVMGQMTTSAGVAVLSSPVLVHYVDPENLVGGMTVLAGMMHSQPTLAHKATVLWNRFGKAAEDIAMDSNTNQLAGLIGLSAGVAIGGATMAAVSGIPTLSKALFGSILGTAAGIGVYSQAKTMVPSVNLASLLSG